MKKLIPILENVTSNNNNALIVLLSQPNACYPCSPDETSGGSQCNPCSPDQVSSGNSGVGCFITSACVESMGLPDDCIELQTLHFFYDTRKKKDPIFVSLIDQYYKIAPCIVKNINKCNNVKEIYYDI